MFPGGIKWEQWPRMGRNNWTENFVVCWNEGVAMKLLQNGSCEYLDYAYYGSQF